MIGNWLILIFLLSLLAVVARILTNPKAKKDQLFRLLVIILLLFGGCTVLYPNKSLVLSPRTPVVQGKFVDDNGDPVRDMPVVVKWFVKYYEFPSHGHLDTSDVVVASTDNEGAVILQKKLKPLSFALPPLFYRDYHGIYVFTVDNRYESAAGEVGADGKIVLRMHKITSPDQLLTNYHKYDSDWRNGNSVEANRLMEKYKEEAIQLITQKCRH